MILCYLINNNNYLILLNGCFFSFLILNSDVFFDKYFDFIFSLLKKIIKQLNLIFKFNKEKFLFEIN